MNKDKTYLFGNWKMYLDNDESIELAKKIKDIDVAKNVEMAVFPSSLSLSSALGELGNKVAVGAQNVYWIESGGYTGEISAAMYDDIGCKYALVGHSERRHQFGESDEDVRKKIEAALSVGIIPVLCVGETQKQRDNELTEEIVNIQLKKAYTELDWPKGMELIVAYEPVWAIGTGNSCSVEEAEKEHIKIKSITKEIFGRDVKVLYGGSVRPENILDYLASKQIDGVLVGGASTKIESWKKMIELVSK